MLADYYCCCAQAHQDTQATPNSHLEAALLQRNGKRQEDAAEQLAVGYSLGVDKKAKTATSKLENMPEDEDLKNMSSKDIEVFKKLMRKFSPIYNKSSKLMLKHMESFTEGAEVVFNPKPKNIKVDGKEKEFRGSKYRGVSVNGKSWQVFIVINKIKWYAGSVNSQLQASALYDKLSIIFHGPKAKTNFSYTKSEVDTITMAVERS